MTLSTGMSTALSVIVILIDPLLEASYWPCSPLTAQSQGGCVPGLGGRGQGVGALHHVVRGRGRGLGGQSAHQPQGRGGQLLVTNQK